MYCKTCGNILRDGDTVCNVCGAKVAESIPRKEDFPKSTYPDFSSSAGIPTSFTYPPKQPAAAEPYPVVEPLVKSPYEETSGDYANNMKFSWNTNGFTQTAETTENVELKWGAEQLAQEQVKAISAAARENSEAEQETKRVEQAREIFVADTVPQEPENVKVASYEVDKGNEEFQELLDEKFEKMQEKQSSIDESRNRLSGFEMTPEVATPDSLVQKELSPEERILAFLAQADKDTLEALEKQMQTIKNQEAGSDPVAAVAPSVAEPEPVYVPPVSSAISTAEEDDWDFSKVSSSYEPITPPSEEQVPSPEPPAEPTATDSFGSGDAEVEVFSGSVYEPQNAEVPIPEPQVVPAPTPDPFAIFSVHQEAASEEVPVEAPEEVSVEASEETPVEAPKVVSTPQGPSIDYETMFLPQTPAKQEILEPKVENESIIVEKKGIPISPKDIINRPIIFPFDKEDFLDEPVPRKAESVKTETEESLEAVVVAREKKAASKEKKKKESKPKEENEKRPSKGRHSGIIITILIDVLIVLAVLLLACFAILKIAPESTAGKLINEGAIKIISIFGLDNAGEKKDVAGGDNAAGGSSVSKTSDKETLIAGQLYNNKDNLIDNVYYDSNAKYRADATYAMEGVSDSSLITNNLWLEDEIGPILYDETAVGTVIRFDSLVIDYINNGNADVLSDLLEASEAETKLSDFIGTMEYYTIESLGIGDIRRNGDNFFVWTTETVTETEGGVPTTKTVEKVYKLVPVEKTMKVSDFIVLNS